ncbi:MAG TPA: nuclease-related domain-containing protein [Candidatus Binatia bacterium]
MQILRPEGEFFDSAVRLYSSNALASFVVRLGLLAISFLFNSQVMGMFGPVVAISLLHENFRKYLRWFPGRREDSAAAAALNSLPDDYVVLDDAALPGGRGTLDHLVVGPNGLFVIETKNYTGEVKCEGYEWYVNRRRIPSISRHAKNAAIAVRNDVAAAITGRQGKTPSVVAALVFTEAAATLKLHQPSVPVLRVEELAGFIRDYRPATYEYVPQAREERQAIVQHIRSLRPKTDGARFTAFSLRVLPSRFRLS